MANSHPNRRTRAAPGVATLCLAGLVLSGLAPLGLLGVAGGAEIARGTEKIVLEAVPLDIDYRNNKARFRDVVITQGSTRIEAAEANVVGGLDFENGQWTVSGNVRIKAENGSLKSDKAVVSFNNNLISRAVITGGPAEFEQQRDDGTIARGHAGTITYEPGNGIVSLRENAFLSPDGCNEIKAQLLTYNIKMQRVENQPQAQPGAGGRITITIQPKGDSGSPSPCQKTGAGKKS
ncbi:MAG TPA: lipopolysaccharide transport periplasmic protein LptA [Steroidobacteraceae bacterium]|nr:lipopolysaccharide transport periplasmic protein LptA [Steroidobacteraceae bacterium]